jgi:S-formylglutathione hydrolase FrmB
MHARLFSLWFASIAVPLVSLTSEPGIASGTIETVRLESEVLSENRIGIETNRSVTVYLPPGYSTQQRRFPVVYFLHNVGWSPEQMIADGRAIRLMERAFAARVIDEFILVLADFRTPTTGSIYENSPVSGRWLDFITRELVPFTDRRYRTIPTRNSRAVVGDFFGGRGALKLAMVSADVFSVAYALHPVATGAGSVPWQYVPIDWPRLHAAKSYADLGTDFRTRLFVTVSQAFTPNLNRPPFYADYFMELEDGTPKLNPANASKVKAGFLLDETLPDAAEQLRTLRGLAFDWGRFDETRAHVESNREFSRKLLDLAVEHEAEEYSGNPWDRTWTDDGRFYTRVLPFLAKHLEGAAAPAR